MRSRPRSSPGVTLTQIRRFPRFQVRPSRAYIARRRGAVVAHGEKTEVMRQPLRRTGSPGAASLAKRFFPALRSALHVAFDRLTALLLLVSFAPMIVGLMLAIRYDSPGPAFFRCERVGLGGRTFRMLKFRKMWDGATGAGLTAPDDARLTRLGTFLAASKL